MGWVHGASPRSPLKFNWSCTGHLTRDPGIFVNPLGLLPHNYLWPWVTASPLISISSYSNSISSLSSLWLRCRTQHLFPDFTKHTHSMQLLCVEDLKTMVKEIHRPRTHPVKTTQDHTAIRQQHFFFFPSSTSSKHDLWFFLSQTLFLVSLPLISKDSFVGFSKQGCIFSGS